MTAVLYLATAMGLIIAAPIDGDWQIVRKTLLDQELTSVAVAEGTILAGSPNGIWRSTDDGQTWQPANQGLSLRHVRWLEGSLSPPALILAGTEPAGIFVSFDNGGRWQSSPLVSQLRDRHGWFLPYSPEAGCVRGFAVAGAGETARRIYAAVEVGGVLFSEDDGSKWRLVGGSDGKPNLQRKPGPMIHPDVHALTVHPSSPELVTAATGGGLYRSGDGGRSWQILYRCYIRAVWVDPDDAAHIIAGPADGVARNGRIEASFDGGKTWQPFSDGMQAPWSGHMVERFVQSGRVLLAILSNGQLWSLSLDGNGWRQILPEAGRIRAVATGPK